jgi:hypothetical protein
MNYRKLWESTYGDIPKDDKGRSYEIHHKDGNRKNNELSNLMCVSLDEHYEIHSKQYIETGNMKDLAAARMLAGKLGKEADELRGFTLSSATRKKISDKLKGITHSEERREAIKMGRKNGKSCVTPEAIEARKRGMKQYYKDASEEELRERWDKISEAHKGKVLKEETKEKLGKHFAKHSDEVVLQIAKMIEDGVRYKVISETFGISQAQITAIKQRKTYKWLWMEENGN